MDSVFSFLAWTDLFVWLGILAIFGFSLWRVRYLSDVSPAADGDLPKLAVIVPALNEEVGIRAALESLLAQDYPGLIIVPVNDRSTDRTGAIMDEVAAGGRLSPIHVQELPPEWLGKNHANWLGAREAMRLGAEWLLFTDGDVQFAPQSLRKAIACARRRSLAHLTLAPQVVFHGFGEGIMLSAFLVAFVSRFQPWFVDRPGSRAYCGIGAFNLVRRDAYEAFGTHETLRLTIADDVALGKLVRDVGLPRGFLDGYGEVSVEWQPNLVAMIRGLYKNTFPAMNFNVGESIAGILATLAATALTFVAPFATDGWTQTAAMTALGMQVAVFTSAAIALRRPWWYAFAVGLCSWFGGLLLSWIMAVSMLLTLVQGGVVWRGTLYPMRLLRERQVRV